MTKINIVIGTTSLNRPMLHNDIFPDWIKWLGCLNKEKYNLTWFINIDIIKKLNITYDETVINFNKLINNMCTVNFLKCEGDTGNFLKACKRLSQNIENFVGKLRKNDDTKIIWLEDDWKLNLNQIIDINALIEIYSGNNTHINLTFIRNNYIHALAPSIMSYNLWRNLHYNAWKEQETDIDPEHCVGVYYVKHYGKYLSIANVTIINKKIKDKYFEHNFLNYEKSYYIYHNKKYDIKNKNHIHKQIEEVKNKFNNIMTFIRITPTACIDGCNYGRKFMEEYDIKKNKGDFNGNFYNINIL